MLPSLTHYGRGAVTRVLTTPRDHQQVGLKPAGFWVSVDGAAEGWADWCRAEGFRLATLAVVHDVALDPQARVLLIADLPAFDDFAREYGIASLSRHSWINEIDWPRVADRYQGIIIAPYRWDRRLEGGLWYYGWDCASGCIWDASAVASIAVRDAAAEAA